ncbi:MAG: ABC transporter ATP-binding protein [Chloroflexi bacterium]|nr:ABC transporter ATP-binding protein [Chloroflexota bacterium]
MSTTPILEVRNLFTHFSMRQGFGDMLRRREVEVVRAVDGVSFSLEKGEVLALVGESGCGKTTIARTLIGLEKATRGEILFKGQAVVGGADKNPLSLKQLRQRAQVVFQDPYESLNPRATIFEIVAEPLVVHNMATSSQERLARVKSSLEEAGLRPAEDYLLRYPHELSGGQRQRVVIAAAMVLEPELLLADEPVSMLDVSIRAEVLNLLNALRRSRGISILFITHDLGTVGHFADRLAVMYLGRIVEIGPTADVLKNPQHPYTRALLSVVPVPNPKLRRKMVILSGETPNPINLPGGCRFHPRCPLAVEACKVTDPPFVELGKSHQAACLLAKVGK